MAIANTLNFLIDLEFESLYSYQIESFALIKLNNIKLILNPKSIKKLTIKFS